MSKKKLLAIIFVLVFLLAAVSVFGFLSWKHKSEMVASPVSFTVNAQGWDVESSSPVPLHVTGKTLDDEKVDVKYFVGGSGKNSGKDLMLKPGSYDVEVYASPINGDGGMYRCSKAVKVSVPKNTDKKEKTTKPQPQSSASASSDGGLVSAELDLSPIPANEITDEEIEKAEAAMKEAGLDAAKIKTFTDSARTVRQNELDRIKAKEEAERIAKEREAMGMYPGAGGPRPANAQPLSEGVMYGHFHCWLYNSEFDCINFKWNDTNPAGKVYYEGGYADMSAGMYPANAIIISSNGATSVAFYPDAGLGVVSELHSGQAYYYGDHVFGATNSGLTYWNSRTGKGAFMSDNAYIPF